FQGGVHANALANFLAVDVRKHDVQDHQIRAKLLDEHPRVESVVRRFQIKPAIAAENVHEQLDQIDIVVHNQQLAFAALQRIGRNAVLAHKAEKLVARNAAEAAARNPKSLQGAIVEAANDRLLTYLTDLRGLAGREDGLECGHGLNHPSPCRWFD